MTDLAPASEANRHTVYLVFGDDHNSIFDFVESFPEKVSPDAGIRDLNITHIEGKQASLDAIHTAAYALPFLTDHRLVIVSDAMDKFKAAGAVDRLISLLDGLPPTTVLVLTVEDEYSTSRGAKGWQTMDHSGKKLLAWVRKNPNRAVLKICRPLPQSSMPGWIIKYTREKQKAQIAPQAAAALASIVGNDTGQARQEIIKLLDYVDYKRQITLQDVQEAAVSGGQADVFAMVDAMALGNAPLALRHLGRLLEEQEPANLFGMIVRQFRLLILTKEAVLEGVRGAGALAKRAGMPDFVASKMIPQAEHYTLTELEGIYHRLYELDKMIKTGQIEADVAMQTFVAGLTVSS